MTRVNLKCQITYAICCMTFTLLGFFIAIEDLISFWYYIDTIIKIWNKSLIQFVLSFSSKIGLFLTVTEKACIIQSSRTMYIINKYWYQWYHHINRESIWSSSCNRWCSSWICFRFFPAIERSLVQDNANHLADSFGSCMSWLYSD